MSNCISRANALTEDLPLELTLEHQAHPSEMLPHP